MHGEKTLVDGGMVVATRRVATATTAPSERRRRDAAGATTHFFRMRERFACSRLRSRRSTRCCSVSSFGSARFRRFFAAALPPSRS